MAEKTGVQSVERIFQLIEQLAAHPTGVSLQKLAGETGLAKSTVHRLLASLVGLGYVAQNDENGHYRLTLKMFELSSGIVDSMSSAMGGTSSTFIRPRAVPCGCPAAWACAARCTALAWARLF